MSRGPTAVDGGPIGSASVAPEAKTVDLGDELVAVDEAVSLLRSRMADERVAYRALETELRRLESVILGAMGTSTRGVVPNGTVYELCVEQRGGYTVAPSTRTILRRKANRPIEQPTAEELNQSSSAPSTEQSSIGGEKVDSL